MIEWLAYGALLIGGIIGVVEVLGGRRRRMALFRGRRRLTATEVYESYQRYTGRDDPADRVRELWDGIAEALEVPAQFMRCEDQLAALLTPGRSRLLDDTWLNLAALETAIARRRARLGIVSTGRTITPDDTVGGLIEREIGGGA